MEKGSGEESCDEVSGAEGNEEDEEDEEVVVQGWVGLLYEAEKGCDCEGEVCEVARWSRRSSISSR